MRFLSYQYVTSCIAFRAGLQRSLKKELFFFLFLMYNGQFSVLISVLQPHCWAVLGHIRISLVWVVNGLEAFTSSAIPVTTEWASVELT